MKNSKFWVWFIPVFMIVCVGLYYSISMVDNMNSNVKNEDNKVVEEYKNVGVTLSDDIKYVYVEQDNLSDLIENHEGILFIGNSSDDISKKSIMMLNDAILSTDIESVYYLNNDNISYNTIKTLQSDKIVSGMVITFKNNEILNTLIHDDIKEDKQSEAYSKAVKLLSGLCDESC